MPFNRLTLLRFVLRASGFAFVGLLVLQAPKATAQRLTRPIFRVNNAVNNDTSKGHDTQVLQAATRGPIDPNNPFAGVSPEEAGLVYIDTNVQPASASEAISPLDLTQHEGEHPLMPCLRLAKRAMADIDQNIQDYSATFTKVERLNGSLGAPQQMLIRVRHQPFSVYLKFIQPTPGQEALYVANSNGGKMVALASGWKRRIGTLNLDPNGAIAMRGQRYPITKSGIRNLTAELIEIAESDVKYAECDVTVNSNVKIDGRPVTMVEATHPVPRKNFKFHKARIFIDQEYRMPVAYEAYSWPPSKDGAPLLEERYIYTNLKINNGFGDEHFSAENPAMFK